jgi:uroporphyrinogen decarboxylase
MTPRERLVAALNHREPDRVPFDLGATIITSITKEAYVRLRRHLGLPEEPVRTFDHVQQLPFLDEALLLRLGTDARMVQTEYVAGADLKYLEEDGYYYFVDRWGSKLRMPKVGGHYFDWVEFPIKEISLEALDKYQWPELDTVESLQPLARKAEALYGDTSFALAGSGVFGGGVFEQPARMMGMELFLMSLVLEPRFADAVMEGITDLYIENCNRYLDLLGRYIQVFVFWDDMTGQSGPMISPEIYRKLIKPKQRRILEAVRRKTDAKIFFHNCGASREFLPDLIEIGVDILNPVQVSAKGMDTAALKKDFGRDLTFWGGGCDTQYVLPRGTPEQVREEVKRRIHDLAPGGGFVFAAVHNIQAEVPPENIMAMVETLHREGAYW